MRLFNKLGDEFTDIFVARLGVEKACLFDGRGSTKCRPGDQGDGQAGEPVHAARADIRQSILHTVFKIFQSSVRSARLVRLRPWIKGVFVIIINE